MADEYTLPQWIRTDEMTMDNNEELPKTLPESLRDIAGIIGLPKALELAEFRGGTRIRVPVKYRDDHYLVPLLGHEMWSKFWYEFQGQHMDLPRNAAYLRNLRNQSICAEYYGQRTAGQIALRYKITERSVYKIVSEMHDPMIDVQRGLFEPA